MRKNMLLVLLTLWMLPLAAGHHVLTASAIIEVMDGSESKGIVLIQRKNKPVGIALPGGKVEHGETVEQAVAREIMEEVNLNLNDFTQFHVYSDPARDPRFHAVDVVFRATSTELPVGGDDAAQAFVVKYEDMPWNEIVFDHAQVIRDYFQWREGSVSK